MLGVSDSITTFTGILFPVLVFGLDSAYSAFYFKKEDPDRGRTVFSTIGITFFIIGFIPLIMCLFSGGLSVLLFQKSEYRCIVIV